MAWATTLSNPHVRTTPRIPLRSSFESNFYLKLVTLASNTLLLAAQVYVPYRAISRTGLNPALAAWARALLTTLDSNDQSLTHPYFGVWKVLLAFTIIQKSLVLHSLSNDGFGPALQL